MKTTNYNIKKGKAPTSWLKLLLVFAAILLTGATNNAIGQTTIFTETMGSGGSNGATIATWETNNYFDNDGYTMSGNGDMRNTSVSDYTGASGTWNVMLNAANENFQIAGIYTTGYTDLALSFGIRKNTNAETGSTFSVQCSSDGSTWTTLTMPALPTGQSGWYYRTCTGTIPATSTLYIKFTSSSTTEFRIDDVKLVGTSSACADPTTQATMAAFGTVTSSSIVVNWTRGGTPGDGVIVVAKAGSAPTDPVDGTSYTANAAFGSGTDCGASSFVVFMGAGTTVTVTGLAASTTYYFEVFEKNCTGTSIKINTTSPASGNQITSAPATPAITLADNGTQIAAANVSKGTSNLVINKSSLAVTTANASLTGMTCTTAGTYASADITNLKVWYSTNTTFESGTDVLLSTLTTPGVAGAKTFPAFTSQTINSGNTGYIFITADIAAGAIVGNTININALTTTDFTFASGTKSGSSTAGGSQTFVAASTYCFEELFTGFSAGTHATPNGIDVASSLNTYTTITGWTGTAIYQAGGEIKLGAGSTKGLITTPAIDLSSGDATLNFDAASWSGDATAIKVFHASDGSTFTQVGSNITLTETMATQTLTITGGLSTSKIRIEAVNTSNDRFYIDNFRITCGASGPTITASPTTLTSFTYVFGSGPSANQTFTISGANLTGSVNITVTPSTNYEVSTDGTTWGGSTITYPFASGIITGQPKTVYVRLKTSLPVATYDSQTITISGGGATNATVTCSGSVTGIKPEPTNHATAFSCGIATTTALTFTWTDATGTQLPDKYLILCNTTGTFANPVDGTVQGDVAGSKANINQGVKTVTFSGLNSGTIYYFKLFPYTNSGTSINYKTDGTVLIGNCTTNSGPCLSESAFASLPSGWAETDITYISGEASFASMTGALATVAVSNPSSLTFDLRRSNNTKAKTLYVEVSTTTQGGSYTTLATYDHGNTTSAGTKACTVDLSAYTGNSVVYIKFRKVSSTTSPWYLDNVSVDCGSPVIKPEPTNHVTGFSCTVNSSSAMTLNWTDATGATTPDKYLIKWSNVSLAAVTDPSDGTPVADGANAANVAQGVGTYNVTGLTSATTYYFKIFPYTNAGANINFKTTATVPNSSCTTSNGPCLTESTFSAKPTGWAATNITYAYGEANFASNNGELTTVAVSNPSSLTFDLRRSKNSDAKTMYVEVSTTSQVGSYTTVATYDHSNTTSGDTEACTFDLSAYAGNGTVYIKFRKASSTNSPWYLDNVNVYCESCSTPSTQASDISFSNIDGNSMKVNWTNGNGTKKIVIINTSNSFTNPTNGSDPASYSFYLGSGEQVVYNGTANTVDITGLSATTTYWFRVYEYKCTGLNTQFNTSSTTNNPNSQITTTCAAPLTQASSITFTGVSNTTTTVNWTKGNGSRRIVIMNTVNSFTNPTNGIDPTANSEYSGFGEQIVYNGSGSSLEVTGLTTATTYWYRIYEYNCTGSGTFYNNTIASNNPNSQITNNSAPVVLLPGEMIFVGYDSRVDGSKDKYYIANLVELTPGTKFNVVNSRYEACAAAGVRTNRWGGGGDDPYQDPGIIYFTWNGSTNLAAGSIFTFTANGTDIADHAINETATNDMTDSVGTQQCNIHATSPDQIYITQGVYTPHGAVEVDRYNTFVGNVLFGLTNGADWVTLANPCSCGKAKTDRVSRLPNDLECFNINGGLSVDGCKFYKNSAPHSGTKKDILLAIMNETNWTTPTNTDALNVPEDFDPPYNDTYCGKPFTVSGSSTAGTWLGGTNNNWFNCNNWEGLTVPDQNLNVVIPAAATNDCDIDESNGAAFGGYARCKNLTLSGKKLMLKGTLDDRLYIYGNFTISGTGVLDMDDNNNATDDGQIYAFRNWNNTIGTSSFLEGNSTVVFYGNTAKTLNTAEATETFYKIRQNGNNLTLNKNVTITNNLSLLLGIINTAAYTIDLGTTGSITETAVNPSSYVVGNIKATRDIGPAMQNFGGLGLEITETNGTNLTTVTRITGTQLAGNSSCCSSNLSIGRSFIISPTTNTGLNATLKFNYFTHELFSVTESDLMFYKAPGSFTGDNWEEQDKTILPITRDIVNNNVTIAGVTSFSQWTLASKAKPLPIELINFTGKYIGNNIELNWATASETNNHFFTIERSSNAINFNSLLVIPGAGNSSNLLNYNALDKQPMHGINYYRLQQTDYDGKYAYSPVIAVNKNEKHKFEIIKISPENNLIKADIEIDNLQDFTLEIYDVMGELIYQQSVKPESLRFTIEINLKSNIKGMNLMRISNTENVFVKKFIITQY